ncbi:MAG: hypothetical protein IKX35_07290, partial [Bacteroidales bacterium]|nr:hypothetical protein [Bacteroidales bacterium]
MKRITTLKHNLMRAAMTLALIVTCATAWATDVQTYYIDENGTSHNVTATVLTGSETRLTGGWYVVKSNISYTNQIGYTSPLGTINIILADGAEMTVNVSNNQTSISLSSNFPLAIYGQSAGTGRLTVTSENNAIYAGGGLTINGGIVSATSTGDGYSAIYADDKAITINGGQVTATPGDNATGICTYGTITLGLNKSTDFITANGGYFGTVNIKSGQTLYDGATAYSGNNVSLPSGTVTLRPYSSDDFSVSGDEYTIHTAAGWGMFCDMLADNDKGIFTGKTVKLGASISVSRMAGSAYHDFTGIFNGQGNTLTFTYSATEAYAAPFRYVEGPSATVHAAIQNLNVNSTVTGTNCRHLSGLIGLSGSNVDVSNCNVEVHITSTKSSDNELYPSGLMSQCTGPVIISGCTVTGEIGTNAKYAAGFLGIVQGSATIATITNCVSSVTINSSTAGDGTHGGFVAVSYPGSTTIEGCLFNGKLLTVNTGETATGNCGGFVGWRTTGTV